MVAPGQPPQARTCCLMRRKMTIFLGPYLSEEQCGIPDSILADFMRFDITPEAPPGHRPHAVIGFKFCPWCGKPFSQDSEVRIHDVLPHPQEPDEESGEAWKDGGA